MTEENEVVWLSLTDIMAQLCHHDHVTNGHEKVCNVISFSIWSAVSGAVAFLVVFWGFVVVVVMITIFDVFCLSLHSFLLR